MPGGLFFVVVLLSLFGLGKGLFVADLHVKARSETCVPQYSEDQASDSSI